MIDSDYTFDDITNSQCLEASFRSINLDCNMRTDTEVEQSISETSFIPENSNFHVYKTKV